MKNEEIEEEARYLYDIAAREDTYTDAAADMGESLREFVGRAYDKAAKATCALCRHAAPVVVIGSVTDPLVPLGETVYLHRRDGRFLHVDTRCDAELIHRLKDSLVNQEVASR